jgi:hypothetical protein
MKKTSMNLGHLLAPLVLSGMSVCGLSTGALAGEAEPIDLKPYYITSGEFGGDDDTVSFPMEQSGMNARNLYDALNWESVDSEDNKSIGIKLPHSPEEFWGLTCKKPITTDDNPQGETECSLTVVIKDEDESEDFIQSTGDISFTGVIASKLYNAMPENSNTTSIHDTAEWVKARTVANLSCGQQVDDKSQHTSYHQCIIGPADVIKTSVRHIVEVWGANGKSPEEIEANKQTAWNAITKLLK